jgi:hypothetical protein
MPTVNQNLLPDPTDSDAWNGLIGVWADKLALANPLARLAWHVTRLFYEHSIIVPVLASLSVIWPAPINLDPASDYSSEEEGTGCGITGKWLMLTSLYSPLFNP